MKSIQFTTNKFTAAVRRFSFVPLMLLIVSCGIFEVGIEESVGAEPPFEQALSDVATRVPAAQALEETPMAEQPPVLLATPTAVAATPLPEPTLTPAVEAAPVITDPLAGITYSNEEGAWLIDAVGQPTFLIDQPYAQLSPTGDQVAYWHYNDVDEGPYDIWLEELASGQRRNLTSSPASYDSSPIWWPAHPGMILFSSQEELGPGFGLIQAANTDDGQPLTIDPAQGGPFALSPDGEQIAYGGYDDVGRIYQWQSGKSSSFVPALYGLEGVEKLYQPAYSPDSRYLAWEVGGTDIGGQSGWSHAVAVLDLEARTSRLLHPYPIVGGGSVPSMVSWSPDGNWIAFVTFGEGGGRGPALYVISSDGEQEIFLGPGVDPIWSPDGSLLAYNRTDQNNIWLADSTDWEWRQILAPGSRLTGWIDLSRP